MLDVLQISLELEGVLQSITDNSVSEYILSLKGKKIKKLPYNLLSIDKKGNITFSQVNQLNNYFKNHEDVVVLKSKTHLKSSENSTTRKIMRKLGIDVNEYDNIPKASVGEKVKVSKLYTTTLSKKTYALYEGENNKKGIINVDKLEYYANIDRAWEDVSRNNTKIGRLTSQLIKLTNNKFSDKQIEDFIASYRTNYEMVTNGFNRLSIIQGEDIRWAYSTEANTPSSCMPYSSVNNPDGGLRFNLYCDNPNHIQLIVVYDNDFKYNPRYVNGKLISDAITTRALLWTDRQGRKYVDRIYTRKQDDMNLVINYTIENNYFSYSQLRHNASQGHNEVRDNIPHNFIVPLIRNVSAYSNTPYADSYRVSRNGNIYIGTIDL